MDKEYHDLIGQFRRQIWLGLKDPSTVGTNLENQWVISKTELNRIKSQPLLQWQKELVFDLLLDSHGVELLRIIKAMEVAKEDRVAGIFKTIYQTGQESFLEGLEMLVTNPNVRSEGGSSQDPTTTTPTSLPLTPKDRLKAAILNTNVGQLVDVFQNFRTLTDLRKHWDSWGDGQTPIHLVVLQGDDAKNILSRLLELILVICRFDETDHEEKSQGSGPFSGPDPFSGFINAKNNMGGNTAFHLAIENQAIEIAKCLYNWKADFTCGNDDGVTPLDLMYTETPELVQYLLDSMLREVVEGSGGQSQFEFPMSGIIGKQNTDQLTSKNYVETQLLANMMNSKRSRHLTFSSSLKSSGVSILIHPLVKIFLDEKWKQYFTAIFVFTVIYISIHLLHTIFLIEAFVVHSPSSANSILNVTTNGTIVDDHKNIYTYLLGSWEAGERVQELHSGDHLNDDDSFATNSPPIVRNLAVLSFVGGLIMAIMELLEIGVTIFGFSKSRIDLSVIGFKNGQKSPSTKINGTVHRDQNTTKKTHITITHDSTIKVVISVTILAGSIYLKETDAVVSSLFLVILCIYDLISTSIDENDEHFGKELCKKFTKAAILLCTIITIYFTQTALQFRPIWVPISLFLMSVLVVIVVIEILAIFFVSNSTNGARALAGVTVIGHKGEDEAETEKKMRQEQIDQTAATGKTEKSKLLARWRRQSQGGTMTPPNKNDESTVEISHQDVMVEDKTEETENEARTKNEKEETEKNKEKTKKCSLWASLFNGTTLCIYNIFIGTMAYVGNMENILQIVYTITICLTSWPVWKNDSVTSQIYAAAAVSIVLAWLLILMQLANLNCLGMYIQMFRAVVKSFLVVIGIFVSLLAAFSVSFTILFPNEPRFSSFPASFFRVTAMMTGELNYDGLFEYLQPESNSTIPPFPYAMQWIHMSFVVAIVIILVNLLIGLTVSDIQAIQNDSDIIHRTVQVERLYVMEVLKKLICCWKCRSNDGISNEILTVHARKCPDYLRQEFQKIFASHESPQKSNEDDDIDPDFVRPKLSPKLTHGILSKYKNLPEISPDGFPFHWLVVLETQKETDSAHIKKIVAMDPPIMANRCNEHNLAILEKIIPHLPHLTHLHITLKRKGWASQRLESWVNCYGHLLNIFETVCGTRGTTDLVFEMQTRTRSGLLSIQISHQVRSSNEPTDTSSFLSSKPGAAEFPSVQKVEILGLSLEDRDLDVLFPSQLFRVPDRPMGTQGSKEIKWKKFRKIASLKFGKVAEDSGTTKTALTKIFNIFPTVVNLDTKLLGPEMSEVAKELWGKN